VLTEGPINVSYIRRVSTEGRNPRGTGSVSFSNSNTTPTATDRLNYIAASAPGVTLGIQAYEERRVVTDDPKAAVQERESFERDILTRYAALLSQLKTAGVLSETEAEEVKTPVLDVKVLD
jgi:hypothetical protein